MQLDFNKAFTAISCSIHQTLEKNMIQVTSGNRYDIASQPENMKIPFLHFLSVCRKSKICKILMVRQAD